MKKYRDIVERRFAVDWKRERQCENRGNRVSQGKHQEVTSRVQVRRGEGGDQGQWNGDGEGVDSNTESSGTRWQIVISSGDGVDILGPDNKLKEVVKKSFRG